ncbi:hypothetical protein H0E87_030351 [Populus deltoides]|uniref:Uncharacterized protein n=1 Tax=Populus deltoides TaxID=3696 RepID=A0A8T2WK40_POPDE|nr:hypothetical protein H0E87_030351 [Populus deltoides]
MERVVGLGRELDLGNGADLDETHWLIALAEQWSFTVLASKPQSSPLRTTGVEKLLDMGLDLFKDKKSLSSSSLLSGSGNVENIHQPRRLHVRLMQWRYANDRADTKQVEDLSPASKTKECSLSVIRRAPLLECAKNYRWIQFCSQFSMLRISQLPSKSTMSTFSPSAEQTVGLQSQLAEVAAQEKLLIEECLELLQTVSILQVESGTLVDHSDLSKCKADV